MKILFVLFSLNAGGVTTATDILAAEMVKNGHSVKMLSLTDNTERQKILEKQGFEVETLGYKGLGLKTFVTAFFDLNRYFSKNRDFDAAIVASAYPGIIATAAAKLTKNKAKILVNYHTHISYYAAHEPFFKKLILFFGKFILRMADVNANVSQEASRDAEKYFGIRQVETLYNPILPYAGEPAKHRWFNDPEIIPIVAGGRLSYVKDFTLMLDAFREMLNYNPRYRLILIGSGEMEKQLKAYATENNLQDHVDFTGWIDDYRPLVEPCRFFWMTSRYEGFGLVLVEALSTGIPCVSVDCPSGPREALQNGKYGLLISSRNPETIAKATHLFAQQPMHPREFYKQRAKDFLPEVTTQKYLDLLQ